VHIILVETVDAEAYQSIILQFGSLLPFQEQDCWIQQDGAAHHMTQWKESLRQDNFKGPVTTQISGSNTC
jgi:hypothetical protein